MSPGKHGLDERKHAFRKTIVISQAYRVQADVEKNHDDLLADRLELLALFEHQHERPARNTWLPTASFSFAR